MKANKLMVMSAMVAIFSATACGTNERDRSSPAGSPAQDRHVMDRDILEEGDVDRGMADRGRVLVEANCQRCHAPGAAEGEARSFHEMADQRDQQWLMDFMMNNNVVTDERQGRLEDCQVRQPRESLDREEARQVIEYMRTL
jgi:mono/diheme cytochrome c family protein